MGISVMIKLNLAYAIFFIGLLMIYDDLRKKEYLRGIFNAMAYGTGIIIIILLTILPYYLQDNSMLWYKSVIQAPLEYSSARRNSILKMAPFLILFSGFFIWIWKKKYINFKDYSFQLLLVAILGVLLSFVVGGRINGHYLIQLYPMLILIGCIVISKFILLKKYKYQSFLIFFLLLLPAESYLEYAAVLKNKLEKGTFYNGEGISVPNYIMENNLETHNILFLGYHIGYWILDESPPTKSATHPSNICKDEMFASYDNPRKTSMEELRYIMETIRPKTIIVRKNRSVFDKLLVEENDYINGYISKYYKVYATVQGAQILQRL
jgi:hypothetical protein